MDIADILAVEDILEADIPVADKHLSDIPPADNLEEVEPRREAAGCGNS